MTLPHVLRRACAALLIGLLGAAVILPASPAQAATTSEEEGDFFQKLNAERAAAGLARMQWDGELAVTSRSWSKHMAAAGQISHDPNLAKVAGYVEPGRRVSLRGRAAAARVVRLGMTTFYQRARRKLRLTDSAELG